MAYSKIFAQFEETAKKFPNKTCVTSQTDSGYRDLTYLEIFNCSLKLAKLLEDNGIKEEDRVAILLSSQPEWPIAFMAIQALGAVAVPLDLKLNPVDIRQLLLHSEAKAVLATVKAPEETKQLLKNIEGLRILYPDAADLIKVDGNEPVLSYKENLDKDKLAALFYTSGTTKMPKAVMLSQENFLSNISSFKKMDIAASDDVFISVLPLHHTYPFMVTCLFPLLLGAKISYPKSIQSQDVLKCISETGVTVFTAVPEFFSFLNRRIKEKIKRMFFIQRFIIEGILNLAYLARRYLHLNLARKILKKLHAQFGKLKYMVSGGAKLDPQVSYDFFKWGFTLLEGYGLTETSPVVTFNLPGKLKIGSAGRVIPDVQVKISEPDKSGIGEIWIKGPNVMAGYYKLPEQNREVLHDGWFSSGDLGYLDKEGYLFITGRKDEVIVLSSGEKINPEEIEKYYGENPYIKEIFVFACEKDPAFTGTNRLKALIVPDYDTFRRNNFVNIEEKMRWELDNLSKKTAPYKRINGFSISTKPLARTPLGKIMRNRIKFEIETQGVGKREEQAFITEEDQQILSLEVFQELLKYLSNRFKKKVHLSDHLELDLGLDSLNRIELLLELQEFIKVQVPEQAMEELFFANTIRELAVTIKPYLPKELSLVKSEQFQWSRILNETPSEKSLKYINLNPSRYERLISYLCYFLVAAIFKVFFLLRTKNRQNFPGKGPCLIYANHTSYLDPLVIAASLPFKLGLQTYFVGFKQIFLHPLLKPFIRVFRLVPIDINYELPDYLQICAYLLKKNKIIVFFPEGQRAPEGKIIGFKKGVGILAKEINPAIQPVYIDGAFRSWPRGRALPKPALIKAKFGKIFNFREVTPSKDEASYEEVADALRNKLIELEKTKT